MPDADQPPPLDDAEAATLFEDFAACRVLVLAASGGPDSTALCLLMARWRASLAGGPDLHAVTIDHGLRPEAAAEAAAVARFAGTLGVPHRTLRWDGAKPATGMQAAARAARYRLLAQEAERVGAYHIVTAHTRDDQAETVLFRLARGSGLSGLAGMTRVAPLPVCVSRSGTGGSAFDAPARFARSQGCAVGASLPATLSSRPRLRGRVGEGVVPSTPGDEPGERLDQPLLLVRPFLDLPKARLIATLAAAGIPFADDPSNRDPRFTRARLREFMPALAAEGLTPQRLSQFAHRMRRADEAIEAAVDRIAKHIEYIPPDECTLDRPSFRLAAEIWIAAPTEVRLRLLGRLIAQAGNEGPVELGKLETCERVLAAHVHHHPQARFCRTLAGAIISMTQRRLCVACAPPRRPAQRAAQEQAETARCTAPRSVHQQSAK